MSRRESDRKYFRKYAREIRLKALSMACNGGEIRCAKCGFNDVRALQIDHVNGSGNKHRKARSFSSIFFDIARGRNTVPVQVLCANCNWIKRHENMESPGRPRFESFNQSSLFNEEECI